nr:hypothetical protein BSM_12900 [uncultured archaeon]
MEKEDKSVDLDWYRRDNEVFSLLFTSVIEVVIR